MENLLSTADFADLEIHCKNGKVQKCHKNLLAARSPFFKTMLESDFKEGNTGIIKLDYMELEFVKVNKALHLKIIYRYLIFKSFLKSKVLYTLDRFIQNQI